MQKTKLRLPFDGEWLVSWGGDTKALNHHHGIPAQNFAYDFIVVNDDGSAHKGNGSKDTDYYAFGRPVVAPADGYIAEAVDGVRDNVPLDTNDYMKTGNYILIKHLENEFSFLAHLKQGSVAVKAGDKVKRGQKIGECGNSGNSSDPHLHYHLQDSFIYSHFDKNWKTQPVAKGIKVQFENVKVKNSLKQLYSPIKNDKVKT